VAGRKKTPKPTSASGLTDGRLSFAVATYFQFNTGGYFQEKDSGVFEPPGARQLNNCENLRRGRLYFTGKIGDWTANLTPDFGGSPDGSPTLYEANLNYTISSLTATIGYFKPYDTLARSQFSGDSLFMERPSIAFIASEFARRGSARANQALQ
jgi:phosphate-selective porin OprO/OprP